VPARAGVHDAVRDSGACTLDVWQLKSERAELLVSGSSTAGDRKQLTSVVLLIAAQVHALQARFQSWLALNW
jgi:hypothetical protein